MLSGAYLSVQTTLLKSAKDSLVEASASLPCMRTCSSLADVLLHDAFKLAGEVEVNLPAVSDVLEDSTVSGRGTPRPYLEFRDINEVYQRDAGIARHTASDDRCKVGIITTDSDHGALLTTLVAKLSKAASSSEPGCSNITYRVYIVDSATKPHTRTVKGAKVHYSTMREIAGKCKYVVFLSKNCLPVLDFFTHPTWMHIPCPTPVASSTATTGW